MKLKEWRVLNSRAVKMDTYIFSSPGRRPWELLVWRSVRPASTFSFKRLLLKNH